MSRRKTAAGTMWEGTAKLVRLAMIKTGDDIDPSKYGTYENDDE